MTKHAKLSASGAHRWVACPGSIRAEESYPNSISKYAMEGTVAHELSELCLNEGTKPHDMIDKTLPGYDDNPIDAEMADATQLYIDFVNGLQAEATMVEERVDFSDWVPEGFGTSDIIAIKGSTLHVVDLKYGKGIKVYAEDNPQGMLYALGAYALTDMIYDIETVSITIVQPRLDHIDTWELPIEKLLSWGNWISERAELALSEDAERSAGEDQCKFCRAKATCPTLKKLADDVVLQHFDDCDPTNPDKLTDRQLKEAMDKKKLIVSWLDAVEKLVKDKLDSGEGFTGYKLVAGRNMRSWTDETDADETLRTLLGDDRYVTKLLTPAAAEKTLGKTKAKGIQTLIATNQGQPALAPESDKRPAVSITAEDFDDESGND